MANKSKRCWKEKVCLIRILKDFALRNVRRTDFSRLNVQKMNFSKLQVRLSNQNKKKLPRIPWSCLNRRIPPVASVAMVVGCNEIYIKKPFKEEPAPGIILSKTFWITLQFNLHEITQARINKHQPKWQILSNRCIVQNASSVAPRMERQSQKERMN